MKKARLILILAFLFSLQNTGGAQVVNAALNCKQVKTEVLKLEKAVAVEQAYFAQYNGQVIRGKLQTEFDKSNRNMFLQKLGKIQYNNESCFSKSQYDQIKKSRYWLTVSTIKFESRTIASGKDCKNNPTSRKPIDLGAYEPKGGKREVVCDVPTYFVIYMKSSLYGKSIYEY
jgi:hypothetical protein